MSKLGFLIYILTGPTVAGIIMLVMLNLHVKSGMLVGATLAGFVIALPIAWAITKKLSASIRF